MVADRADLVSSSFVSSVFYKSFTNSNSHLPSEMCCNYQAENNMYNPSTRYNEFHGGGGGGGGYGGGGAGPGGGDGAGGMWCAAFVFDSIIWYPL